jgi:hypothetical protein
LIRARLPIIRNLLFDNSFWKVTVAFGIFAEVTVALRPKKLFLNSLAETLKVSFANETTIKRRIPAIFGFGLREKPLGSDLRNAL